MEKLATKRNISLLGIVSILIVLASYFVIQNSYKEEEKFVLHLIPSGISDVTL